MKMRNGIFLTTVVVALQMVAIPISEAACSVSIKTPTPNASVGATGEVSGSADFPNGNRLWVFAHLKGLGVWWPQGGGAADIDSKGEWKVISYFGVSRDVGKEFEITARVVDATENGKLEQWVKNTIQSGQYPGIPMPNSVPGCNVTTVIVTKTG